jgi:hypothetical protein
LRCCCCSRNLFTLVIYYITYFPSRTVCISCTITQTTRSSYTTSCIRRTIRISTIYKSISIIIFCISTINFSCRCIIIINKSSSVRSKGSICWTTKGKRKCFSITFYGSIINRIDRHGGRTTSCRNSSCSSTIGIIHIVSCTSGSSYIVYRHRQS